MLVTKIFLPLARVKAKERLGYKTAIIRGCIKQSWLYLWLPIQGPANTGYDGKHHVTAEATITG